MAGIARGSFNELEACVMTTAHRGARLHIAVLGRCNTGKSTVLNLIAGQRAAIVSSKPGTTGDPVPLSFELLPLGPVTLYDTAGLDEASDLGALRREAGRKILARADMAVVVTDRTGLGPWEKELIEALRQLETPFLLLFNKRDQGPPPEKDLAWCREQGIAHRCLSADRETDPAPLREDLIGLAPAREAEPPLVTDLLPPGGVVVCVTPIDASAPKGRLIVPQVQALRELVEANHPSLVVQHTELPRALSLLRKPPDLVITDSQVVREVNAMLPPDVPLTTFSLLFARLKGDFSLLLEGARAIDALGPEAPVLIAESCSHHPQDDDIGRVKIPRLLRAYTKQDLHFAFCAGSDFPDDLSRYAMVLHCGGCMLNAREMRRRLRLCAAEGVPATNYGMALSHAQGILERVAAPLVK
ncbi:(FeFe) hydrogenase H-cluster maturation GTPase HydF [uncultured delta proteobacterium]|uniref:(FeFe) hydrogenase H-cluster maturation GTPase HydF n=1 Tax=uncultured delta proteobacterium TaxID=34034 RepID=A0A212JB33_9DELT|nr:(FeFe) hydrogenase H-cluster maturation GTPase HydF [uncultured delta proteobacterium]